MIVLQVYHILRPLPKLVLSIMTISDAQIVATVERLRQLRYFIIKLFLFYKFALFTFTEVPSISLLLYYNISLLFLSVKYFQF